MNTRVFYSRLVGLIGLFLCCAGESVVAQPVTPQLTGPQDLFRLCKPTILVITDFQVLSVAPGTILPRPPIYYVAGRQVDIAMTIPACTGIQHVQYGGVDIPLGSVDGVEQAQKFYTIERDEPLPGDLHRVTIRLHLHSLGRGNSTKVRVTAASIVGTLANFQEITLVDVKEVGGTVAVSISANELRNNFFAGIYDKFGDDARHVPAPGEGGNTSYDPSYSYLPLTGGSRFLLGADGITLAQRFTVQVDNWCDQRISVAGRFQLVRNPPAPLEVQWDKGPSISMSQGVHCDAVEGLVMPAWILRGLEEAHGKRELRSQVQTFVDESLGSCDILDCAYVVSSVVTSTHDMVVQLLLTFPRVVIEVPYNTRDVESPFNTGLALNPNESVAVLVSGVLDVCLDGGGANSGSCQSTKTGPKGLFNWNANSPVPYPWQLYGDYYQYFEERAKARAALVGFTRESGRLPRGNDNPAALLVRLGNGESNDTIRRTGFKCGLTARPDIEDRAAFSANDYRSPSNNEYGSGTWRIVIGFAPGVAESLGACQ